MYMSDRALRVIEYVLCLFVRYCTNKVFPISKKKKISKQCGINIILSWWSIVERLIELNCADCNSNSPHYSDKMRYRDGLLHIEHYAKLLSKD